jgi:hypothetical protein
MTVEPTIPPLRDFPHGRLDARRTHLAIEIGRMRTGNRLATRISLAPRRRVATLALAFSLLVIGTAVAATNAGWLTGTPAPQAVTSDFGSYTPQLGFTPEPGRAVLVAQQADVALFATTNTQGGYCLIASTPWKRSAQQGDGGTCLSAAATSMQLVAGVVGARSAPGSNVQTFVVAGRTIDVGAKTIRFADPAGTTVTTPVGASGFFVTPVRVSGSPCANGDWVPSFSAIDGQGKTLSSTTITLGSSPEPGSGACELAGPHS